MPSFELNELLLLSHNERRARRVPFHPRTTVIRGANTTGKSSLLKSIFRCLGAEPVKTHDTWRAAKVIEVLTFTADDRTYRVMHNRKRYTVFDGQNRHLGTFDSVTKGFGPYLANLLGFGLKLPDRQNNVIVPPPAFLLLPFYVDQDEGWIAPWRSFSKTEQFPNFKRNLAEYHAGIRPNEFYAAKGRMDQLAETLAPLVDREATLQAILADLEQRMRAATFDLDIDAYREEVRELLVICDRLKKREEGLREELVRHYSAKTIAEAQIAIATSTLDELQSDSQYIADHLPEQHIDCPTCGAHYQNSFAERFAIAQDEDRCHELLGELREELKDIDRSIEATNADFVNASTEFAKVRELLATRRGEIQLRDVIESEGKKEVQRILRLDIANLERQIQDVQSRIERAKTEMARYEDAKRKKQITARFRELLGQFLSELDVHTLPADKLFVHSRIAETGSDLPRALLAYYFSMLHLIRENPTATFCPIVIDSPNQQDQDVPNLTKILRFIRDRRPENSQLVLGLVDTCGVEFDGDTEVLTDKLALLNKDHYESTASEVRALLDLERRAVNEE